MSRPKILISRSRFFKPGGLDSQDKLRLRNLNLSRQTFKTCQGFLDCWNKLFFVSVEIFKIETFQLRLCLVKVFVKIVETNRDCRDLSRNLDIMEAFWVWKWQSLNEWRNLNKKYAKIHLLLDPDQDELSRNDKISRSCRISRSWSRLLGWDIDVKTMSRCRHRESRSRHDQHKARPPGLDFLNGNFCSRD